MAFSLWLTTVLLLAAIAGLEGVEDSSLPPRVCLLPPETGPCKAYFRRYFFHAKSGQCKEFIYGGCRGNQNNFLNKLSCEQKCLGGNAPAKCDWPTGFCNYYKTPCPSNTKECNGRCTLSTNRCCCPVTPKPTGGLEPGKCDWPTGVCTYIHDDCPPSTSLCAENNKGCKLATNHCCCFIKQ
ncbi:putative Kunitz-type serine protease inhibitor [Porites lutea]|uniref:putative Kunitz-type serine protease inhibitor n=1 Tax=Porites lutea TaxID=51062 RepID=UPI003CC6BF3E